MNLIKLGSLPEHIRIYTSTVFNGKIFMMGDEEYFIFDNDNWTFRELPANIQKHKLSSYRYIINYKNSFYYIICNESESFFFIYRDNNFIEEIELTYRYQNIPGGPFVLFKDIIYFFDFKRYEVQSYNLIHKNFKFITEFSEDINKDANKVITGVEYEGKIYLIGLSNHFIKSNIRYKHYFNVLIYNITKKIWDKSSNLKIPRVDSTAVCYDNKIYVIGGEIGFFTYTDTIEMLDTTDPEAEWVILEVKMNEQKSNVSAVIYESDDDISIYIISGKNITGILFTIEKYILKVKEKKIIIKSKETIINQAKITKNIHKSFVYSTVYNNDYNKFISTSGDSTLIIWNIEHTNTEIKEIEDIKIKKILTGHQDRVVCVAWNPDSKECASGSNDCSVIIWNTVDGSIIKKYDDHVEIVRSVDYNNESTLASGSDDKTIIIYNKEKTILHHKNRVRCIKWNPVNVNLLLSGCDDFSITLWDISAKSIIRTFKEHTNFIYSLVWKDEKIFASSSGDESIKIWNTDEVKSTKVLTGHVGNVWSIDWKGDLLVSGGNDKKILVWNTKNYEKQELTGHTGYVVAVNIDEKKNIISGGTDNTIKIWNVL